MTRPKILLYLHHVELGQRYPVSEDIIIGRMTGHILFPKDERLSDQHCRISLGPNETLMIKDLASDHGTVVDGRLADPEKSYPIKDGTTIAVGGQVFKCVEPKKRPKPMRKPSKKSQQEPEFSPFLGFIVLAIIAGVLLHLNPPLRAQIMQYVGLARNWAGGHSKTNQEPPPPQLINSPFEIVYQEIQGAYDQYRQIGKEVQIGLMNSKAMAAEFRGSLIPKFQAAQAKLAVIKPKHEMERRRIEANTRLVVSILAQISAMASFAETNNPKYAKLIEKATSEVEMANEAASKVNSPRVPAARY
jgi:hypothetical protein